MKITLLSLLTLSSMTLNAQFDASKMLDVTPNKSFEIKGNLKEGNIIEDLSWASNSSVACFPATQNSKFRGNHVLYGFDIPSYAEVTITVIPDNKNTDISLYGYQVGTTNFSKVPNLSSCVSCEADYKWDRPKRGKTQDHTRSIWFNSIKNPYNIFFGVTANNGATEGGYTIKIDVKAAVANTNEQKPVKVFSAKSEKGKTLAYKGNLNEGVIINSLDWASTSSNACFPATQNAKFRGTHVIYTTEIPPRSIMTVTLIPTDKSKDMSLYGYQVSVGSDAMVPNLSSCVSCEADHKWDRPKRGKTQDHTRSIRFNAINNPYKIVIGVAGSNGLSEGEFIIQIEIE